MRITMMKSKLHKATVTEADLDYEGSIAIDPQLCDAARFLPFEQVDVYNCNNGHRFTTYVILGRTGEVCVNGAAARLAMPGDQLIIVSYAQFELEEVRRHRPTVVLLKESNQI